MDNLIIEKTFVEGESSCITKNDIRVSENKVEFALRLNPLKEIVSGEALA